MTTPVEARVELDRLSRELGDLSTKLAQCSRALAPTQREYDKFIENYEVGLFVKSEVNQTRLPGKEMRLKLARHDMDAELLGRYEGLKMQRDRMVQRIRDIKVEVNAQQSILSALREEMAGGSSGPSGRWAA